jgi:hypothetical protein
MARIIVVFVAAVLALVVCHTQPSSSTQALPCIGAGVDPYSVEVCP